MKLETFILTLNGASIALNLYMIKNNTNTYKELRNHQTTLIKNQESFLSDITRFINKLDIVDGSTDSKSPRES